MAPIHRVRTTWTGMTGGPGVSTMYCTDISPFRTALAAFWLNVYDYIPATTLLTVEATGDIIDGTSGELTGAWTDGTPHLLPGAAPNAGYSAASGAVVNWLTNTILDGKRLRGKTFMVPLAANAYGLDGTLLDAVVTDLRQGAATFVTAVANNFVVWRPNRVASDGDATHPPVTERAGGFGPVVLSTIPDKAAVLRSRRD